jgi:hypothetical protein
MRNMLIAIASSALLLAGCAVSDVGQVGEAPREAITYAALAKYPGKATTSDSIRTAAVDRRDDSTIEIFNLGDATIPASSVWVNNMYVTQILAIPPRGAATVKYKDLLLAGVGKNDLKKDGQTVRSVELQTSEALYTVQGPARP